MSPVYKLSNAGGFTSKQRYTSMLAGNPVFVVGDFESIATVTVGSGGSAAIDFTSIPSTFQHLQIRSIGRSTRAATDDSYRIRAGNGSIDTGSNYSFHFLRGTGAAASSSANNTQSFILGGDTSAANATAGIFSTDVLDILDYANTNKYKTFRHLNGVDFNGSGDLRLLSGLWQSTSAITDIKLFCENGNWAQYSSFALYGIKG
jgi:hypothetical protein